MSGRLPHDYPGHAHLGLEGAATRLASGLLDYVEAQAQGLGICAISCWEVAKLVERGRLTLPLPTGQWLTQALAYPGVRLLDL